LPAGCWADAVPEDPRAMPTASRVRAIVRAQYSISTILRLE
jgi:hypothetical protein